MTRYGVGVEHLTHWIVPWIGAGCITFGVTSVPTITLTYCIPLISFLLSDCSG